jgi:hypothetical protein
LFTNLISNAIKYNREQGIINIKLYQADNYLVTELKTAVSD